MTDSARAARAFNRLEPSQRIPQDIVRAAIQWMVRMQDNPSPDDMAACQAWRRGHPQHELAWQRLMAMGGQLQSDTAPVAEFADKVLTHPGLKHASRRQAVKALALMGGIGWLAWQGANHPAPRRWLAGVRTSVGQQRAVALADGGELVLNTASAVDIDYGDAQRRVILRAGEIMIRTGEDALNRPFVVQTRAGLVTPVGTRFTLRDLDEREPLIRVAVQEGAVDLRPDEQAASPLRVSAGQWAELTPSGASLTIDARAPSEGWVRGMLVADQMPLGDFLQELARYRQGILRCQPSLTRLAVTGAFPLDDTDHSLAMLAEVLPVRIQRVTPYWVTVASR